MSAENEIVKTTLEGFYAEPTCCTQCGVPQSIAPELVGWADGGAGSCYWKRQPINENEVYLAIRILNEQELGCHRYSGSDPKLLKQLPAAECDYLHPENIWREPKEFGPSDVEIKLMSSRPGFFARVWRRIRS